MAIDLINIDNLVLADDFETWFQRTNEVIDALNPLQLYDFYDGGYATVDGVFPTIPGYTTVQDLSGSPAATTLGLKITRDVRFLGDMLIEILPETPLGFNTTTGALTLVFTGPNAPPAVVTCGTLADDDLFLFHDLSAGTNKVIEASFILPPIVKCDHQFGEVATPVTITIKGDLIVDGNQTILSTTNVSSEDKNIDLNDDGTGTGTAAGDDTVADGGGITLLSSDGNKTMFWSNAGDRWVINQGWEIDPNFSLFTTTIEPQNNVLDIIGSGTGEAVSVHWHEAGEDDHWRFMLREFSTGQVAYTLGSYPVGGDVLNDDGVFVLQHSTADDTSPVFDLEIFFDSVTPTRDASIFGFARNLNADLLDGCHASETPTPFFIPCADASGLLDPGWLPFVDDLVKIVNQTAHGFVFGDVVRIDKITPFEYILAQADTLDNAEAVGIVSKVVDANNFHLNMRGCINGTPTQWTNSSLGGPVTPGAVYFLDKTTAGMTLTDPSPGDISKTMMIGVTATQAIVMNYVGGLTDPTAGTPTIQLTNDVLAIGLLGSPLTTSIVERTSRQTAVGGTLPLVVQDNDNGSGNRTFEITMTADTTLELQQPAASAVDPVTNSVTLIIHQDGTGGWVPSITISGGGTIAWDNSASQPVVQTIALKTTIYVLLNVNDVSGVWYGSRAVFEV